MGIIGKSFAIVMFPLSILIVLEATDIFKIEFFMDKILLGAILMITLQIITLIMLKSNGGELRIMNLVTAGVFIITALAYIIATIINFDLPSYVPIILGVMMFVEAMYALH